MRLRISITTVIVFFLALVQLFLPLNGLSFAADASGSPSLFVENPVFDFGKVSEGEVVSHVFEIRNTGQEPLLITSHHAVCGCTSTILDDSEVMPGKTTRLEMRFDTTGFSGAESKVVRVNSNDPKSPSIALSMQGQVQRQLSVTPARLFFWQGNQRQSNVANNCYLQFG